MVLIELGKKYELAAISTMESGIHDPTKKSYSANLQTFSVDEDSHTAASVATNTIKSLLGLIPPIFRKDLEGASGQKRSSSVYFS